MRGAWGGHSLARKPGSGRIRTRRHECRRYRERRVGGSFAGRSRCPRGAPRGRILGLLREAHRRRRPCGALPRPARRSLSASALGLRAPGNDHVPVRGQRGDLCRGRRVLRASRAHPLHYAGAEVVEFSPTDELGETIGVVMKNAVGRGRVVNLSATHDELRREIYEIAETIAPTWERRRADIEEVAAPVRSGCCASFARTRETRCSSSLPESGRPGSRPPRSSARAAG